MRLKYTASIIVVALIAMSAGASATPRRSRRARAEAAALGSVSVGRANRGRLRNGALLEETENVRYRSSGPELRWGTDEIVAGLERAGRRVSAQFPGAQLTVGDISRRNGGRFRPHRSHRNGRDVDVAFYMLENDEPAYAPRFVRIRGNGKAQGERELFFDDARNWAFVADMLRNEESLVQQIFISRPLRQRLLAEAARQNATADLIEKAAAIMNQPRRGGRHDDHFHIRVYCSPQDRPVCVDMGPFHAWHPSRTAETPLHASMTFPIPY